MTIRKALRKLYTAMCGGTTTSETAGDLINDIATDYTGGGGSSLPEPGASGNVLTSNGSAWTSAAPRNDEYIVTADLNAATLVLSNVSVGISDIKAAIAAGKNVRMIAVDEAAGVTWEGYANQTVVDADVVLFSGSCVLPDGEYFAVATIATGDTNLNAYRLVVIPAASAAANGKVLGVSNGAYELVTPYDLSVAPLAVEVTMTGGDPTINNVTAAEINAAFLAHRPVYIDLPAMHARNYLQVCDYTDENTYDIKFVCMQLTSGGITAIQAAFSNSLTGTVDTKTASAT